MKRTSMLAAIAVALVSSPSLGQELQNQGGDFVDATSGVDLSLEVDAEESSTVISYGGYLGATGTSDLTWSVSAEFPIGGKDNLLSADTLDSLSGGPKLSFALNFLLGGDGDFATNTYKFNALNRRAYDACMAKRDATESAVVDQTEACKRGLSYPNEDFVRNNLPGAELELNRLTLGGYSTLGIEGSLGTAKSDFVTPGTLAEGSKRHTTWSLTGSFAYFGSDAVSAYKLAVEFSREPEELDKSIICKTVIVNPADDCISAFSRAPNLESSLVFKGEVRRFFPFSNGKGGIGAALTGGYDVLQDRWEVELPIYFAIPGKSPVLPGLSFGYNSADDKFAFGVFLKTAFKF
jgi:hypothetical protein